MLILRNIALVLLVYLPVLAVARLILPPDGMCTFAVLALLGVDWAVVDAVNLAKPSREKVRYLSEVAGVLAAGVLTIVFTIL